MKTFAACALLMLLPYTAVFAGDAIIDAYLTVSGLA